MCHSSSDFVWDLGFFGVMDFGFGILLGCFGFFYRHLMDFDGILMEISWAFDYSMGISMDYTIMGI